jgi:predicted dehydrogenase
MGRRHAKALAPLISALHIVDASDSARQTAQLDHPSAHVAPDLATLDRYISHWGSTLAIIATWAPSHAEIFRLLVDRGVRKIVCEKPLATSVADAEEMVCRAARNEVALVSNHYFRNSGFVLGLVRLAESHGFGLPLMMTVVGGAHCLVTNGIHWIDFASQLFGGQPESVVSTAHGDPINPRSKDLLHFGGSAIWHFGDRELVMALTNRSSVYPIVQIYFRDAVAEVDEWFHVKLRRRPRDARANELPVTRTGEAVEMVFSGPLPGVLSMEEALRDSFWRLLDGTEHLSPADAAMAALNTCIGALASASHGGPLSLPLTPDGRWGRQRWPIT